MRYFSDKQCGGERKALKEAEAKLTELKVFLDSAPRAGRRPGSGRGNAGSARATGRRET